MNNMSVLIYSNKISPDKLSRSLNDSCWVSFFESVLNEKEKFDLDFYLQKNCHGENLAKKGLLIKTDCGLIAD